MRNFIVHAQFCKSVYPRIWSHHKPKVRREILEYWMREIWSASR